MSAAQLQPSAALDSAPELLIEAPVYDRLNALASEIGRAHV